MTKTFSVTAASVLMVILLATAGCGEKPVVEKSPSVAAPVAVAIEPVRVLSEAQPVAVPGEVRPFHEAVLSSRVQGEVSELFAIAGNQVEKGDLLVKLLSEELSARMRRANVELEAASLELNRIQNLVKSNAATAQELEITEARHRSAEAAADEAKIFAGYVDLRAPFDGTVVRRKVEVGDLVSPGQPVLILQANNGFRLEADVPESLAGSVKIGESVSFAFDDPEIVGDAVISEIEPAADPISRTILMKADLPEDPTFHTGQFGRLFLRGSDAERITVPETSLLRKGQLEYVYVVLENRALLRLVRTGRSFQDQVEILAGLEGGEKVILAPSRTLRDGAPVEVSLDSSR
ncbi:MAG TPA: efflux RND transporter periplasmic adaptor subunit [Opitutales bacterium]|nr:efflux RND transporter periplasmic adaptor subunit [Opitutales bacterium]